MADPNYQNQQGPPPNPYQQQPLHGQRSSEYAPYPQFYQEQQAQGDHRLGTPVMGAPANPNAHPDNQHAAIGGYATQQPQNPASKGGAEDNFRTQPSGSYQDQTNATKAQVPPSVPGQASQETAGPNSSKGPMDQIVAQMTEYGKKAQIVGQNVWSHLTTGPSVADTAWGRMTAGTQILTKGFEGLFKATFPADADETLKKTYACFLSTSTGPVAGTLYISSKKLAFCSDRPLSYSPQAGQQAYSFYKVIIPLDRLRDVAPSENQNKPTEKYIQVNTKDNFEFWFMGFVNYDKGLRNLQAAVHSPGGTGDTQPTTTTQQQPYPPNQQTSGTSQQTPYPPNQQSTGTSQQPSYPPNQQTYHPNQYGTRPEANPSH